MSDLESALLAGSSRGVDVLPSVTTFPAERQRQVRQLALIGPATAVQFQPTVLGLINLRGSGPVLPLMPDLEKLQGHRIVCFCGSDDRDTLCSSMDSGLAGCVPLVLWCRRRARVYLPIIVGIVIVYLVAAELLKRPFFARADQGLRPEAGPRVGSGPGPR